MINGSLPATSIYSTWSENIEIWSTDDDTLADLSGVTEITLTVRNAQLGFNEMELTLTNGDITIPSTGIVQWRVEADQMGTMLAKLYEVIMVIEADGDSLTLFLGPLSIVE